MKTADPARTQQRIEYLHRVARETRASAAQMDQLAGLMQRRLNGPAELPIPCCQPGPCMICGAADPPGHMHVELPDSFKTGTRIVMGRVCSAHSIWDLAKTGKFMVTIEGELES